MKEKGVPISKQILGPEMRFIVPNKKLRRLEIVVRGFFQFTLALMKSWAALKVIGAL